MCITKGAGCRRLPAQQIITCKVDICLQPDVRNRFICTRDGSISYYGRQGSRRPEWRTISLKPKLHSRPCLSPPAATLASWSTVLYNMPIAYNKRTIFRKRLRNKFIIMHRDFQTFYSSKFSYRKAVAFLILNEGPFGLLGHRNFPQNFSVELKRVS